MHTTTNFAPQHLEKWTLPDSYFGPTFYEYYVFFGQNRDSDLLTQSNFAAALEKIGGETETVLVVRQGHWACGWIELIMIHESDIVALIKADEVERKYKDYPIVDEDHFSDLEHQSMSDLVTDNMDYFIKELLEFVGADEVELTSEDRATLEQFIYYAVSEDGSYRGADEAYFRPEDCSRFINEYIKYNHEYIKGENATLILISLIKGE